MLAVAVVEVPDKLTLVFKTQVIIPEFNGGALIHKNNWNRGYYDSLKILMIQNNRDYLVPLIDFLFEAEAIAAVSLVGEKEFRIHVFTGRNPKDCVGYVLRALRDMFFGGAVLKVIRATRLYLDDLSFDIPLGNEITIGEPKSEPCRPERKLTFAY